MRQRYVTLLSFVISSETVQCYETKDLRISFSHIYLVLNDGARFDVLFLVRFPILPLFLREYPNVGSKIKITR